MYWLSNSTYLRNTFSEVSFIIIQIVGQQSEFYRKIILHMDFSHGLIRKKYVRSQ